MNSYTVAFILLVLFAIGAIFICTFLTESNLDYLSGNNSRSSYTTDLLFRITEKTGNTPHLVSFPQQIKQKTHDVTSRKPLLIPNVVHLIRFGKRLSFVFYNYVSLKSIDKFLKPSLILIWTESVPSGKWWSKVREEVANVYLIKTEPVHEIGGKPLRWTAHASDYFRVKLLYDYGGIYLDNDAFCLKSFDSLRVHGGTVLGAVEAGDLANGVMLSPPDSFFLKAWLESYNTFWPTKWLENSVFMAYKLWRAFPHLVHLEARHLVRPRSPVDLYRRHVDISQNYALHLWDKRLLYIPGSEEELAGYDCTIGDGMRYVLYGDITLRSNKTTNGAGNKIFQAP